MRRSGYLAIGRWRGVPVLLHWTTPLGALWFSGFSFAPALWVAFVGLVLVHELGHAYFVQRFGARVLQVEAHALGGLCTWSGRTNAIQRAVIAWGGVVAQGLVLAGGLAFLAVQGRPEGASAAQVLHVAIVVNLWMIGLNLLPFRPLDGAAAWPLFPLLWRRRKARQAEVLDASARAARRASRVTLREADALEDEAADAPPAEIASLVDDVLRRAKDRGGPED